MTIRYACEKCGSVLKIKEDRAGKEGHCPKCKSTFVVPAAETAAAPEPTIEPKSQATASSATAEPPATTVTAESPAPAAKAEKPVTAAKAKSPAPVAKVESRAATAEAPAVKDDDFDPVAFLMTDGPVKAEGPGGKQVPAAAAGAAPDLRVKRGAGPAGYSASDEPDVRVGGPRTASTAEEDEEAEAQLLKRRPKRPASPPSASQSADEMLRVNAATSAKELMTKTVEESRIRAAQMPKDPEKPGVDYKATARELFLRFAPAVIGVVLAVVAASLLGHMIVGGRDLPELGEVSGTVTKGGQPLVDAHVIFSPVDVTAGAASAYTDASGYYELKYTEDIYGAVLGKNKVEVSLIGKDGREVVKPMTPYGLGSKNIETIVAGSQTIDIKIP